MWFCRINVSGPQLLLYSLRQFLWRRRAAQRCRRRLLSAAPAFAVVAARDPVSGLAAAWWAGLGPPRWLDRAIAGVAATAADIAAVAAGGAAAVAACAAVLAASAAVLAASAAVLAASAAVLAASAAVPAASAAVLAASAAVLAASAAAVVVGAAVLAAGAESVAADAAVAASGIFVRRFGGHSLVLDGDCCFLISQQENKAVPIVEMSVQCTLDLLVMVPPQRLACQIAVLEDLVIGLLPAVACPL